MENSQKRHRIRCLAKRVFSNHLSTRGGISKLIASNPSDLQEAGQSGLKKLLVNRKLKKQSSFRSDYLKGHNLQIHGVPSDGNCLFESLANILPEPNLTQQDARDRLIHYLLTTSPAWVAFMTQEIVADVLQILQTNYAWGDTIHIQLAEQAWNVRIRVLHEDHVKITSSCDNDISRPLLMLAHIPGHYMPVF